MREPGTDERVLAEQRHADTSAFARRLLRTTAAIANAESGPDLFVAVVDGVAAAVGATSAGLWLVDERSSALSLVRSVGYSDVAQAQLVSIPLDLAPSVPAVDAVRLREPIWIPSQERLFALYPHLRSVATAGQAYRVSCLPLAAPGRIVGVLGLTIDESQHRIDDEDEFLVLIARHAAQAVERLRLFNAERANRVQTETAARRLHTLNRTSRAFANADLDLPSRLASVASELAGALDSCVNVALVGSDGLLHLTAVRHPIPEGQALLEGLARSAPIKIGEGTTGAIVATGKSVILPSIDVDRLLRDSVPAYRAFLERFPPYALIGAPLTVRGRIIGAVTATRGRNGETYAEEDLRLLEDLADRAALAIDNSQLYQETVDERRRAEQLYRFAQAVEAADGVDSVFAAALTAIEAALGAKRASILTFDSEGVMRFRAWRNLSDEYRANVDGHSPWSRGATSPEPLIVEDALNDSAMSAYAPALEREGIGALAFVPLVNARRLLGKFMVYYDRPHRFLPHEIETARAIANHLASVIVRFEVIAKLEETIRFNEVFAGILAHDLRNPLGAVMTTAQHALSRRGREGDDPSKSGEARALARILSSGRRMNTMIDQLLDFTRVRTGGRMPLQVRETNIADICLEAVGEIEQARPDWKIECRFVGNQSGTWDPDRLLQVFSNLVSNAGQHGTGEGAVQVRIDGTDASHVTLAVHNMGAIPDSLLPHVFDPFRGAQQRRHQSRGLGLGLFIVREIVRAHGGTVNVSSSETVGTTFIVELPRASAFG